MILFHGQRKGLRGPTLFGVEAERLQGIVEGMSPFLKMSSRSTEVTFQSFDEESSFDDSRHLMTLVI
jgi:hypothetical protein